MNDALESIMSFINENTTMLICICIFLIVVLVFYLIETSIKAKRLDKKMEEEKQKTKDLVEQHNIELEKEKEMKEVNKKFEDAIINNKVEEINLKALDLENDSKEEPEVIVPEKFIEEEKKDNKEVDVMYKNDQKLSEILFGDIEKQPEGKLDESIVKNEEEIEELSAIDELDEIMKKLNSYESNQNN